MKSKGSHATFVREFIVQLTFTFFLAFIYCLILIFH